MKVTPIMKKVVQFEKETIKQKSSSSVNNLTSSYETNSGARELLKMLRDNGLGQSTTNVEDNIQNPDPIQHILTYEEMFLKRVTKAKFREQTIPQTAIRKMVAHEMEQYVFKTFKKSLES